mmetsp:Transcript_4149/g.10907  ORF Transcript_4149/g.10907 Transcript_4149/m.10907 type:complete len:255 (-) Transcript_4149:587-1351(-)
MQLHLAVVVLHVERALRVVDRRDAAEAPRPAALPIGAHALAAHVVRLDVAGAHRLHARGRHVLLEVAVLVLDREDAKLGVDRDDPPRVPAAMPLEVCPHDVPDAKRVERVGQLDRDGVDALARDVRLEVAVVVQDVQRVVLPVDREQLPRIEHAAPRPVGSHKVSDFKALLRRQHRRRRRVRHGDGREEGARQQPVLRPLPRHLQRRRPRRAPKAIVAARRGAIRRAARAHVGSLGRLANVPAARAGAERAPQQ